MEKNSKIYVAGHRGLVGSAIVRNLQERGFTNIIGKTHKELDLTRQDEVEKFFEIEKPEDFVIATGEQYSVRDFCDVAFREVGIEIEWQGEGINEKGIDKKTGRVLIEVDPKYFRPSEVDTLLGDPTKAKEVLGWNPRKTSFEELVKIMVKHDLDFVEKDHILKVRG